MENPFSKAAQLRKGRKAKVKGPKTRSIKRWVKVLDGLWSPLIKDIWGRKCFVCGRSMDEWKIDAHHWFWNRTCRQTRFSLLNGVPLCFQHHVLADSVTFSRVILARLTDIKGAEWVANVENKLTKQYQDITPLSISDYVEIEKELKFAREMVDHGEFILESEKPLLQRIT